MPPFSRKHTTLIVGIMRFRRIGRSGSMSAIAIFANNDQDHCLVDLACSTQTTKLNLLRR
jgi:hypothetical protein